MNHEIETDWIGKMQFDAHVNGHTIIMDATERGGGDDRGPIPKPFILTALSGCTGMDVVNILRKQKREITSLKIKVTGEISSAPPIEYTAIHIRFEFTGNEADSDAAIKAVQLSQEKYCGVSAMLKKIMPVTWEISFNGINVFSNQQTAQRA